MKNYIYCFTIFMLICITACNKNDKKTPSNTSSDAMDARIAAVTNNMQTKYGTFVSSASMEGNFKPAFKVTSFQVGSYSVEKKPTGMYFAATSMNPGFAKEFPLFFGKHLNIGLNG